MAPLDDGIAGVTLQAALQQKPFALVSLRLLSGIEGQLDRLWRLGRVAQGAVGTAGGVGKGSSMAPYCACLISVALANMHHSLRLPV